MNSKRRKYAVCTFTGDSDGGTVKGPAAMRRAAMLVIVLLLFSCQGRAAKNQPQVEPPPESAALIFTSMQPVKGIRVGSIHNRIMGLEGEIPNAPVSTSTLTLGTLGQSLDVRLAPETRIDEGVRITASSDDGTVYTANIDRDAISTAGHDEVVFGYYFSVPFENKPWKHLLNWRLKVFTGKVRVLEKELAIPARDLMVYLKTTDDPFDVADVARLARGQTYKLYYQNLRSDLLIAYWTSDYSVYVPIYVGRVDPQLDSRTVPEITIGARARPGTYFLTHKALSAISPGDQELPVFGFKVID